MAQLRLMLVAGVLMAAVAGGTAVNAGSNTGGGDGGVLTSLATMQRLSDAVRDKLRLASSRLALLSPLPPGGGGGAGDVEVRGDAERVVRNVIEDILKMILEFIRLLWDPTPLGDYPFVFDSKAAKGHLNLTGLSESHLRDLVVDDFSLNVATLCAEVDLRLPQLVLRTHYDVDVSLNMDADGADGAGNAFRIFGNDRAKITLENVKIHTDVCVTVSEFSIKVANMRLSVEKDKVEIWNLFDGAKISKLVSGIATDMVPELVKEFQTELTEFLMNSINDFMKRKLPTNGATTLPTP